MVDSWEEKGRVQMRSFMHHATGLCTRIGLPGDRMLLRGVGFPLDSSPYLPEVRMHMTDLTVGKHSSMAEMQAIALETVHTYSLFGLYQMLHGWFRLRRDRPWRQEKVWVWRSCAVPTRGRPTRGELLWPCGAICNYEAEMEAIRIDIEAIGTRLDDGSAA
jgi:hypothetical protein